MTPTKARAAVPARTSGPKELQLPRNYIPLRTLAARVLCRIARWLDPDTFFNSDASLEIDRLRERLEVGK